MRAIMKLAVAALGLVPLAAAAQEGHQLSCTNDMTYSKEFLAKFPRAPAACNEVSEMKGEKWARFDAEVKKREGDQLTVTFIDKEHQPVSTMTFQFDPEAQVTTENDEPKLASKLEPGEKLKIWMPESRIGLYAKPGASESQHFALVSSGESKD
jgi:hypothetical protein